MRTASSADEHWRQVLRTFYADMERLVGPEETRTSLEAAATITSADRRIDPASKADYLQQLNAIRKQL